MNKAEAERAGQLEAMRARGEILGWWFEAMTFRLAEDGARYTPDFMVHEASGLIRFEEVKGNWEEAALVRIKVAATLYPFPFVALRKRAKKDGGGWDERAFKGWRDESTTEVVGKGD